MHRCAKGYTWVPSRDVQNTRISLQLILHCSVLYEYIRAVLQQHVLPGLEQTKFFHILNIATSKNIS